MIAGVLLAAGESRRYGGRKLLEPWLGEALIARAARALLSASLRPVVVVVPPSPAFLTALATLEVAVIENRETQLGMSHSIALGLAGLPEATPAALLGVADQPLVDEEVIGRLCEAYVPGSIVVPCYGGQRGNPCIFDRRFFAELAALRGDHGGQAVIASHPGAVVERNFPERIGWDVDRPEDWARLLSEAPAGGAQPLPRSDGQR